MTSTSALPSLRSLLLLDAATCLAMGLALDFAAAPIASVTGLPQPLLLWAGIALLPIAAFLSVVALRPALRAAGARLAIAGNVAWVLASLALLASGWVAPNSFGLAFVLAQAFAVAALTGLELAAVRRCAPRARIA